MTETPNNTETPDNSHNDQNDALQRAANLLEKHEHEILNLWIEAVSEQVPGARNLGEVEIGDHLHDLLTNMVGMLVSLKQEACSQGLPTAKISLPSALHGRERATLKEYTVGQVVHEYAVLRRVITHFFQNHGLPDAAVLDTIACVIEFATLNAVNEFTEAIQATQQKLISTLVHDVRTPLGVAATYVELLSRKSVSDEQKEAAVKTVRNNLARVVTMLEDLLDSAKPSAGRGVLMRFMEADLREEIKTLCIEATHVYNRAINFSLPDHPVVGIFDTAQIIRTMENLISNAVKFGDKSAPIDIALTDEGDRVAVQVHNQGNPIPTEKFEHIFSFFSSAVNGTGGEKGWGLGLALIKTIAACHGGEVIFQSSQSAGTTFGMTLLKHFRDAGETQTVLL